jgi:hypothetical protein
MPEWSKGVDLRPTVFVLAGSSPAISIINNINNINNINKFLFKLDGAEEACWAHNPKVTGSKPVLAKF